MKNSNLNSVSDQTYRKKTRKCCDVISGKVYRIDEMFYVKTARFKGNIVCECLRLLSTYVLYHLKYLTVYRFCRVRVSGKRLVLWS